MVLGGKPPLRHCSGITMESGTRMGGVAVTFIDTNGVERVVPDAEEGLSLMEVGKANGVEGIYADCGGSCSCATCHVYVDPAWMDEVGPGDEIEAAMLDMVSDIAQPNSRLSGQIKVSRALDGLRGTVAPTVF
jgi:2Fe-2S ferredoxin